MWHQRVRSTVVDSRAAGAQKRPLAIKFLMAPPPLFSGPGALWYLERVYSHPVFRHSAGVRVKNRVAESPFHRYLERVYSHPVFRYSSGVPLKNRVAVSPFHRYLERVYSHPVFHTSPSIYTENYVWLHIVGWFQDVVSC